MPDLPPLVPARIGRFERKKRPALRLSNSAIDSTSRTRSACREMSCFLVDLLQVPNRWLLWCGPWPGPFRARSCLPPTRPPPDSPGRQPQGRGHQVGIDAIPPRLDNQYQRGDVPRSVVRLRDTHGFDVHHNGGNRNVRRSRIDPLTATAPVVGSAAATSRSRRNWSSECGHAAPPPGQTTHRRVPQDATGVVIGRHDPPRAGPGEEHLSEGCRAGRSRSCTVPWRGPAPAGHG